MYRYTLFIYYCFSMVCLYAIDMTKYSPMQMAYESLAMITTAVSRITNGQIGVCR